MSVELIILLIVIAFPGALAVEGWDWACHRRGRALESLIGHGIIVSIFAYGILQGIGCIDLTLLADSTGSVSYAHLVVGNNLYAFMAICAALYGVGYGTAKLLAKPLEKWTRKSPYGQVWSRLMQDIIDGDHTPQHSWIFVRTKSGYTWYGRPFHVPPSYHTDDFISLKDVRSIQDGVPDPTPQALPVLVIPVTDIEFLQLDYPGVYSVQHPPSAATHPEPQPAQGDPRGLDVRLLGSNPDPAESSERTTASAEEVVHR